MTDKEPIDTANHPMKTGCEYKLYCSGQLNNGYLYYDDKKYFGISNDIENKTIVTVRFCHDDNCDSHKKIEFGKQMFGLQIQKTKNEVDGKYLCPHYDSKITAYPKHSTDYIEVEKGTSNSFFKLKFPNFDKDGYITLSEDGLLTTKKHGGNDLQFQFMPQDSECWKKND